VDDFAALIEGIERFAHRLCSYKSTSNFAKPAKRRMDDGQRLRVAAHIHAHIGKVLHNYPSGERSARVRSKYLSAQFREPRRGSNAFFVGERLKRSNRLFQLRNSLSHKLQLGFSLLKFLFRREVACFVGIDVGICHNKGMLSCHM